MADLVKRAASIALAAILLLYETLDALFGPLVRPAIAYLASLRLFARLGRAIAALPPYAALALLAVPVAAIEPFKFVALYWMAQGRLVAGVVTLVVAHLLSILVCERIFHAGRDTLLTIGWFARACGFATQLRDRGLAWVKATAAWRTTSALAARLRAAVRRRLSA